MCKPWPPDRCPNCGHVFAPPWHCPQWVGYIVLGVIALLPIRAAVH